MALRGGAVQRSRVTHRLAGAKPKIHSEGRFGTDPFALFALFAVQLSSPWVSEDDPGGRGLIARRLPHQEARFFNRK